MNISYFDQDYQWHILFCRRQSSSSNSDSDQSSSSDFTSSEDEDDDNSADGVAKLPNTALLLGPSGVGKTVRHFRRRPYLNGCHLDDRYYHVTLVLLPGCH